MDNPVLHTNISGIGGVVAVACQAAFIAAMAKRTVTPCFAIKRAFSSWHL